MKKNLSKKDKQRIRGEAREMEIEDAIKNKVSPVAEKAFKRKAYQFSRKRNDDVEEGEIKTIQSTSKGDSKVKKKYSEVRGEVGSSSNCER